MNQVRKSCYYYLSWIKKIRPYLTHDAAKSLIHALVISKIDYCNSLLINTPAKTIDRLQDILKSAARVISGVSKYDHITPTMISLHWLPVPQRIQYKVLLFTFNALNGQAPEYISGLIQRYEPVRKLRSNDAHKLCVPRVRLKYGDRSFRHAAPTLWNKLPTNIACAQSSGGSRGGVPGARPPLWPIFT